MAKKKVTSLAKRPAAKKKTALAPLMKRKEEKKREARLAALTTDLARRHAEELAQPERTLGSEIQIGDVGLAELTFTAQEEAVLAEPFDVSEFRVKPDGAVYVPHANLTRKMIKAFGRTGYVLRPSSMPQVGNGAVVMAYRLYVHGKPIAFAFGEQDYFENNKSQSYGDAIEATQASGLRRCLKRLGIGLELWDKAYTDAYLAEYCVRVYCDVERQGKTEKKAMWRRKQDPAFWNEIKPGYRRTEEDHSRGAAPNPPVYSDGKAEQKITEGQVDRFWTIARGRNRSEAELRAYLLTFGYTSTRDIKRKHYEDIISAIEHPSPLPTSGRSPGQEG